MEDLRGKIAIVTGSTSGIGRAAAVDLARNGVKVIVHGMNEERGKQVVDEISLFGGSAVFVRQNLALPEAPSELVKQAISHWGALDILVNNAALICNKPLEEVQHEDWDSLFAVNVKAPFFLTQAALPWLKQSGDGVVINVSSINRLVNSPNNLVYDAMKAALNHMTRGLSLDLRKANIRVNAIMPGGTATPMLNEWLKKVDYSSEEIEQIYRHAPYLATPDQISKVIVFLASKQSDWINGAEIPVDGGYYIGE
ncbi:SDR family NAD(P)-dependent oxidoreductase [Paenibacillus psychroresistens]|uniref:SDR family NAD(P)-dependent oxidoreductase n=1 Tax=Paenibacillus psychroresistens TaxID=1778678 RepID=UPI0013917AB4|nr:SDR family oxidoreductase [Paenibacillus psychroresistens]